MATAILALDLGKFNSVLCRYEPESRTAKFRTVRTSALVDAGIEFADLNRRLVGTERFLRRRGCTAAAAGPEGVAAGPRKAVWHRTGAAGRRHEPEPSRCCDKFGDVRTFVA
jgi:hypothetical protein